MLGVRDDTEMNSSQVYQKEELKEMKYALITSRQWFQDLNASKARLNMLMAAQEKAFLQIRKRKEKEVAELIGQAKAGEATVKLMTGLYSSEEKEDLVRAVKVSQEFEQIYNNYVRITKRHEILQRISEAQQKKIEELRNEQSKLDEKLTVRRPQSSWKRIFLSLYCARTEED